MVMMMAMVIEVSLEDQGLVSPLHDIYNSSSSIAGGHIK